MRVTLPTVLATTLVASATVAAAWPTASTSNNTSRPCSPAHARVQARGQLAIAYRKANREPLYACLRASGRARKLVDADWFPRPAVAIRGTLVAWAAVSGEAAEGDLTFLGIDDLSRSPRRMRRLTLTLGLVQIGSMRVKSNESVAWIQCHPPGPVDDPGSPRPYCVKPGRSNNQVVKRDTDTDKNSNEADLLAEGKDVDPRSLTLDHSKLCWVQAKQRHCATLR